MKIFLNLKSGFLLLGALSVLSSGVFADLSECSQPLPLGQGFVADCDAYCLNPNPKNSCEGVFWQDSNQASHSTHLDLLKNCSYETHFLASSRFHDVCGCAWYDKPVHRCQSVQSWQVSCDTFCHFENWIPEGQNCKGIYFVNKAGATEFTHYSKLGCATGLFDGLHISHADKEKQFCDCTPATDALKSMDERDTLMKTPALPETIAELKVLKDQIRAWTKCIDLNRCTRLDDGTLKCRRNARINCYGPEATAPGARPIELVTGQCLAWDGDSYCAPTGDLPTEEAGPCDGGEKDRCRDIAWSQDKEGKFGVKGAWYRSPIEKERKYGMTEVTFSRDQSLGVLTYLLATKDLDAADLWMTFILKNPKVDGYYSMCPEMRPGGKPHDDRCHIVPDFWTLMLKVYETIGYDMKKIPASIRNSSNFTVVLGFDELSRLISAATVHMRGTAAYEGHLQFRAALMLSQMKASHYNIPQLLKLDSKKADYVNPLFEFYAEGGVLSEYVARLAKSYCPATEPEYGKNVNFKGTYNHHDGMITAEYLFEGGQPLQTFMGAHPYGGPIMSNGHDCVELLERLTAAAK